MLNYSLFDVIIGVMSEVTNFNRAIEQLLELDTFFTSDFAVNYPVSGTYDDAEAGLEHKGDVGSDAADSLGNGARQGALNASPVAFKRDDFVTVGVYMTKQQAMEEIASRVRECRKCAISGTRQNAVPGEGCAEAEIVFVGEAPGADEDRSGKPFVGRAGQLLTKIITAMGLTREQVFICNTLKCRPPENRDPQSEEKNSCRHFLENQLTVIKPKVIVALGSHAAKELLQTDEKIGKLRGKFHQYKPSEDSEAIKVMPTYHPAYLLRNYSPDNRRRVWEDIQTVMDMLGLEKPVKQE